MANVHAFHSFLHAQRHTTYTKAYLSLCIVLFAIGTQKQKDSATASQPLDLPLRPPILTSNKKPISLAFMEEEEEKPRKECCALCLPFFSWKSWHYSAKKHGCIYAKYEARRPLRIYLSVWYLLHLFGSTDGEKELSERMVGYLLLEIPTFLFYASLKAFCIFFPG